MDVSRSIRSAVAAVVVSGAFAVTASAGVNPVLGEMGPYGAGLIQADVQDYNLWPGTAYDSDFEVITTFPYSDTTSAHLITNSNDTPSASVSYSLNSASFRIDAALSRSDSETSYARAGAFYPILFNVDVDTAYEINGGFGVSSNSDDLGTYSFLAGVLDFEDYMNYGSFLFGQEFAYEGDDVNPAWTLDTDGGAQTGIFTAGRTYGLLFGFQMIGAFESIASSGEGFIELTFTELTGMRGALNTSPIPEPTSLATLAMVGLLAGRRRRA